VNNNQQQGKFMSDIIIPPLPAPLDNTKLHSPAVVRKWHADTALHWDAVRAADREAARKKEADHAFANRTLDSDEYFTLAQERENQNRARQLERQAAEYAAEKQKTDYLASSPEVALILADNPAQFLREITHWVKKGYEPDLTGPMTLAWNFCHHTLKAPAKKSKTVAG
jgi:hypothetical protein